VINGLDAAIELFKSLDLLWWPFIVRLDFLTLRLRNLHQGHAVLVKLFKAAEVVLGTASVFSHKDLVLE